jgi:cell division protein FtsB
MNETMTGNRLYSATFVMAVLAFGVLSGVAVYLNERVAEERAAVKHEREMKNREIQRLEAENRGLIAENRKLRLEYDRLAEVNY